MDIRLYLDTCTSERRRGARVGVRLRRVRARVRPRGWHLPQGTVAVPNAPVCLSRARACVRVQCVATFCGFGPFGPYDISAKSFKFNLYKRLTDN